jgi:beta-glucosidase-like glycosyl hydrolase
MSDWGATHSTVASAKAGLDIEMGSGTYYGSALGTAISNGQVSESTLNDMVLDILRPMFAVGLFDHPVAMGPAAQSQAAATPTDTPGPEHPGGQDRRERHGAIEERGWRLAGSIAGQADRGHRRPDSDSRRALHLQRRR